MLLGFASFSLVGALLGRRLRATARQIDRALEEAVAERSALAIREQDDQIQRAVLDRAADQLAHVRSLLAENRVAAAEVAAAQEAWLRNWISNTDRPLDAEQPSQPTEPGLVVQSVDRMMRTSDRIEIAFRFVLLAQLLAHANRARSRPMWTFAAASVVHTASVAATLLRDANPPRRAIAASDIVMIGASSGLEAAVASGRAGPGAAAIAEPLVAYGASLAPCAGTFAVPPPIAPIMTVGVGALVGPGALLSGATAPERLFVAIERGAMAVGAMTSVHWFKNLVLSQATEFASAMDERAAAAAEAAAAAAREQMQFFVHDSALQVLQWVQKPDLSDRQLDAWLEREAARLRVVASGDELPVADLARGVSELARGFSTLGLDARIVFDTTAPDGLTHDVIRAAVDILNEALSNILKHSADRTPSVTIGADASAVHLVVSNRTSHVQLGTGTGIQAMHQRAANVGGDLRVVQEPDSFCLTATLPVNEGGRPPNRTATSRRHEDSHPKS